MINTSRESDAFFQKLKATGNTLTSDTIRSMEHDNIFDTFIIDQNLADESLIAFLRDANYGTKDLETYRQYLRDTGNATYSFTTLTSKAGAVLKSFGAAMASMGVNFLIGSVVNLAVNLADNWINALEKQQETTEKLQGELSGICSEISEINSQLETTADRINKLNSKDSLSFIEKGELSRLIAENNELERKKRLLEEQEAAKQKETAE